MRLLWDSESDTLTLTASSEAPNLPVENVQDSRLSQPWRTDDEVSDQTIIIDAGEGNTINPDMVALAGHNLTDGCTLKIQGNATNVWTAPTVDQTITHRDDVIVHFFTGAALRYWRLYIDDDSNPDGYIQLGRLMLGSMLQMPPVEPGVNLPRVTTSTVTESITGQVYGDRGLVRRVPTFEFPIITETQRQSLMEMWAAVEKIVPVVLVVWEESLDVEGPIYCRIDQDEIPWELAPEAGVLWRTTLKFLEVF